MRYLAFSIYDIKADVFVAPFFKSTVGQAVRDFADLAQDIRTTIGRHPEDYKLVQIGEYEDTTGTFVQGAQHISLGFASDHVVKREAEGDEPLSPVRKVS